ncbi:MAG: PAS domain S-box protein [Rhodospirillaceae bacterium]|jgi:adenylate cyclase|nr:PAS domain S-box protein [Rhodospirillaceae bacterium]
MMMTQAAQTDATGYPIAATTVSDDEIAAQIRIVQSVQTQRGMPVLLFGNLFAASFAAYIDWAVTVSSHAIYFLAGVLLLLLPMLRSYIRLRHRPRPEHVSRRRIRLIETYSLLLGLTWAAAVLLILSESDPINGVIAGMVAVYLAFGSVAQLPSMPKASAAYFAPMVLTTIFGFYVYDILNMDLVIIIAVATLSSLPRSGWQSWQDVRATVRLSQEKLQAEAVTHQHETEAIRAILEAVPFPLVVTQESGVLHASDQAKRQFGLPAGDMPALQISDFFVNPEEREQMSDLQEEQGRLEEYEVQLKNAKGKPFWASLSTLPIKYEDQDCWLNAIYVIDDRKQAEAEAREKNRILETTLENMGQGLIMYDGEWNLVTNNRQYAEHFDLSVDIFERAVTFDDIVEAAMRQDYPQDWEDRINVVRDPSRMTQVWRREFTRPTGIALDLISHPLPSGGFVVTSTDITQRKKTEAELVMAKQRAEEQNSTLEAVSNQLAKYISPQLFQAIFSGEQKVAIESKRKKLTVFFSDIVDFTEIADQLESEELTALLNQYLTEMSLIAHQHNANFDKFIGDAMMFYFGDPETRGVKEDAAACVRMAIAMQKRMGELQVEWKNLGLDRPFEVRIGVNTGYCTVGNFGSEDRMDYTIIGSEVNLASRLQSHADVGGILLASETYALVKDWLLAEKGDSITVKGFPKPVMTYRVKGAYDDLNAENRVIHKDIDGMSLTIDRDQLDQLGRETAIRELEGALAQLKE